MLSTTGWCLATWLKVTLILAVAVVIVGLFAGFGTDTFTIALVAAIVLDLLAVRGLVREWAFEARGTWWWFR